jgi:hypothetical protein
MLATDALEVLQVPPVTVLLNVVDAPVHTVVVPVIVPAKGNGLTVTAAVATAEPQLLVTR